VRLGNDLEPHAERLCAEIGSIRKALLAAGARVAAMSGSGSAVFGVFGSAAAAREAAGTLERQGLRAQACATIDRATYQRDWMEH
jgi:4-diphosphocytidyl-2-C-methyl-D-erythritol kinase